MVVTKAEKGMNTRSRIIAIARPIFARDGYVAASLSDIVEKADVTTGAIYHHFDGKKGLFIAVAEGLEQFILDEVVATTTPTGSLWDSFEAGVIATLEICARSDIQRIVFQDAPTVVGVAAWRKIEIKYAFGLMHQTISALADAGLLETKDPGLTAKILLGAIIEAAHSIAYSDNASATLNLSKDMICSVLRSFKIEG